MTTFQAPAQNSVTQLSSMSQRDLQRVNEIASQASELSEGVFFPDEIAGMDAAERAEYYRRQLGNALIELKRANRTNTRLNQREQATTARYNSAGRAYVHAAREFHDATVSLRATRDTIVAMACMTSGLNEPEEKAKTKSIQRHARKAANKKPAAKTKSKSSTRTKR